MATAQANGRAARALATIVQPEGSHLAAEVLAVQAQAPKLVRNAIGQVGPRSYGYVTLDAIVDIVLPLLVEHDLLWRTFPTRDEDGAPALRYRMTHLPSGESDEDVMALMLDKDSPQGQGSALTYARRYALTAYLNLTVDPDDDGAAASQSLATGQPPVDRYAQAAPAATTPQPSAAPPRPSERAVTANQREKLLRPRAQKAGLSAGEFANVILAANGDPPRVWRTEEHASQTLERLLDRLPARLKDTVLDGIDGAQVAKTAGSGTR